MPPSDIYLVRHAQSVWNAAGRWQGQANPPLSEHGRAQASLLARAFPERDVQRVVTSDLERAHETARLLADRFALQLDVDADLRELDVGSWSGRTRDEIRAAEPGALDLYFQGTTGWTGGETYEEHEQRCARVTERLVTHHADETVIAVTHGGTLRAIVLELLEIDASARWRFSGIGHTSITHLTRNAHGWRLVTFNSVLDVRNA